MIPAIPRIPLDLDGGGEGAWLPAPGFRPSDQAAPRLAGSRFNPSRSGDIA